MRLLPIIVFLIFFVLPVGAVGLLIFKLIFKAKNEAWSGVVLDKKHNTTEDFDDDNKTNHFYFMVVKMDGGGRDRKIGLSQQMWETFNVGDRINKPAGKLYPEKV